MSLILNIDTATEIAQISIAKDGIIIKEMSNYEQKNHAGFLQPAIKTLLHDAGILIANIDAVAVTEGPGSYTGIRIGMASAKGLCYALNKPLVVINTLEMMANSAIIQLQNQSIGAAGFLCPMIDARRMEVFTAIYNFSLENILIPSAVILENSSFEDFFNLGNVNFFGSGCKKWETICKNKNAFFHGIATISIGMSLLSAKKFSQNIFSDVAYAEPLYIKEFYING